MVENGRWPGDVVVWIPEKRLLVKGDLVVGPTPYATYYNVPGMIKAIHALIAMTRRSYRHTAENALAANGPFRQARNCIVFPEIDRAFTGDDQMKKYAYRAFFAGM